jgi:hypothetical protein
MANRLSDELFRASTDRVTLGALVIFLLFGMLVLPAQSASARRESGAAGSPDTTLLYSTSTLYRMAEAYGAQGRQAYVRARFTFDLVWPLVYTFFLATAVSWLFGRSFPAGSRWRLANVTPLLGAAFDYLENISASLVMLRYPNSTPIVDVLAPLFTLVKWALVGGSFALLVVGVAAGVVRWSQKRRV